jgi:hypothetical protein
LLSGWQLPESILMMVYALSTQSNMKPR